MWFSAVSPSERWERTGFGGLSPHARGGGVTGDGACKRCTTRRAHMHHPPRAHVPPAARTCTTRRRHMCGAPAHVPLAHVRRPRPCAARACPFAFAAPQCTFENTIQQICMHHVFFGGGGDLSNVMRAAGAKWE
jgi:hypothetical protein